MTATLATGSLLLALGCGAAPSATATSLTPDQPVSTTATTSVSATVAPKTEPTPIRPKGHTIKPHEVRWESAKPSRDGRTLKIVWWSGVEPCAVLDHVSLRQTGKRVIVTLYEGAEPGSEDVACIEIAVQKTTTVKLKAPLGHRKVVDGAKL